MGVFSEVFCRKIQKIPHRIGAGFGCGLLEAELLVEALNASTSVNQLLLAGIERVTLGADFNLDVLLGRTCLDHCTASATNRRLLVVGMDTFLHFVHLFLDNRKRTYCPYLVMPSYDSISVSILQVFFTSFYILHYHCGFQVLPQKRV